MKCYLIYWHLRSLGFIKPYKSPVGKIKERMKWQIQAAKMTFRSSMSGFSLKQRVRRMGTWPIYIEKSQMRWLRHLARMPPECLPGEVFREHLSDPVWDPPGNNWTKWPGRWSSWPLLWLLPLQPTFRWVEEHKWEKKNVTGHIMLKWAKTFFSKDWY